MGNRQREQQKLENHFVDVVERTVNDFMTGVPNNNLHAAIVDMQREKSVHPNHYLQYRNAVSHHLANMGIYPDLTLVDVANNQLVFSDRRDQHKVLINERGLAQDVQAPAIEQPHRPVARIMPGVDRNDIPTDVTPFPNGDGRRPGYLTPDGSKIIRSDLAEIRSFRDGSTVGINKAGQIMYGTDGNGKDREFAYDANGQLIAMKGYSNTRWELLNGQWTCTGGDSKGLQISRIQVAHNGSVFFEGQYQGQNRRWMQTRSGQLMFEQ